MRLPIVFAAATSLIALAAPAAAADSADRSAAAEANAGAAQSEDPIIVEGQRDSYGVQKTSTATRTDTDVKGVPQALTVITEAQIEDQALRSIADILYFVPGASPGTGEGNRDQITLRGNNTTADFFRDGIRDDVQYFRDFYNVDRVEVLKGPNAMIFGRGGGGGVVNRVIKRSTLAEYREFAAMGHSEGGLSFTADLDQPLGGGAGLRVNGVYENGESFRRHVDQERYAINPTVGLTLGADTRIDLSYEYFHDRRTADRGLPSVFDPTGVDEPLEGFDRTFFGDPDVSFAKADVHLLSAGIEHRFTEDLTLRNRTLYGDYDKFYQNVFANGAVSGGTVNLSAYNDTTDRTNFFTQTDLVWESQLGGIDQTILAGFEIGQQNSRQRRRNGFFLPSGSGTLNVPIAAATIDAGLVFLPFNPSATCRPSATLLCTPSNFTKSDASIFAVYAQDQIRPADWLELVVGVRYDRFSLDVTNLNNGVEFSRTDELISPRLGLILKPITNLSLYASYSRSYLPQSGDQFGSLSLISEALKPERFDNYEIGAKWEPIPGLLATAALYQLDRTNTQTSPVGGVVLLSGEQRSKGIELGLERSISDEWQISAGYAYQKAEVTEATQACPSGDCEAPLVPRHTFSLWNRYDVSDKLGLGLGVIARTKSYASISNNVKLPGYARVDAAIFYELMQGVEAQLNVENIFNADYFPTAHNDNNIAPGAPTTARATLRFNF